MAEDTPLLTEQIKKDIDSLTRIDMARLWRFSPAGHQYFQDGEVFEYFQKRFHHLGAFSPEISKQLGWDEPSVNSPAVQRE